MMNKKSDQTCDDKTSLRMERKKRSVKGAPFLETVRAQYASWLHVDASSLGFASLETTDHLAEILHQKPYEEAYADYIQITKNKKALFDSLKYVKEMFCPTETLLLFHEKALLTGAIVAPSDRVWEKFVSLMPYEGEDLVAFHPELLCGLLASNYRAKDRAGARDIYRLAFWSGTPS